MSPRGGPAVDRDTEIRGAAQAEACGSGTAVIIVWTIKHGTRIERFAGVRLPVEIGQRESPAEQNVEI